MNERPRTKHTSRLYERDLEAIRAQVLRMGGLVEEQIAAALLALQNRDAAQAERLIARDHEVNAMEVSIDEECARTLALRQPAANDLRMIVAVIKTITDLERIGDEAEKVGRLVIKLEQQGISPNQQVARSLAHLGSVVQHMLHQALDAFARLDSDAAIATAGQDDKVDLEYQALLRNLLAFVSSSPHTTLSLLDFIWAARAMERIGDHARNICEYVIYLVLGKDVRHTRLPDLP